MPTIKSIDRRKFIKFSALATAGFMMGCSIRSRFDLIIKNGLLYDGLGNPAINGDIGIRYGLISAIADLSDASASRIIDANGYTVSPGFIDIHTHTDLELLANPGGDSKLRQGITTEIGGNCGYSPFPMTEAKMRRKRSEWAEEYGIETDWTDIGGFFRALEAKGMAFNYASFTGHGDIRAAVVGLNDVPPTPEQLRAMQDLLEKSMEMGSLGLSTGLEYAPGSYADTDEITALCRIVARRDGVYATHMRNEDDRVIEAIEEALKISRESGVSLEISHLKACNKNNWDKIPQILEILDQAAARHPVKADRYPYDAWGTGLTSFTPQWARQGKTDDRLKRLEDPPQAAQIMEYANSRARRIGGWDRILISSCETEASKQWEGRQISDCADKSKLEPAEFVRQLLIKDRLDVGVVGFAMSEENLLKVLNSPQVMIGSDGTAVANTGILHQGKPHPRYYGAFPRVLGRYVREKQALPMTEAIRKMTSMPATKLGFTNRGVLKTGNIADITIFDDKTVIDNASYADPHQYPTGIDYVLVNGRLAIDNGQLTGELPGEILTGT